jgi:UDP-3-O-acyl N-acetylglucosamine deacetylase
MSKGKILVVDDEENIRRSLLNVLSDEGYEVALAGDGEEALRMVRTEEPDLVLLDIWIPGIDGIQTLAILKSVSPETEVIMMSGHGAIDTAVKATKLGAFDFVEKPFSLDSILKTIASAFSYHQQREPQEHGFGHDILTDNWFAGLSRPIKETRAFIKTASIGNDSLLIAGATGLGKEVAARLIHKKSARRHNPFVKIDCKSLTEENFDSVLFGGTGGKKNGGGGGGKACFENAGEGILFFNRIDKLPMKLQRRLLKIFTSGIVRLYKKSKKLEVKSRIFASCGQIDDSRSRKQGLAKGLFEFFSATTLHIEPLSERRQDIPELTRKFTKDLSSKYGKSIETIDSNFIKALKRSTLPGQTQELYNIIELAVLACEGDTLTGEHISIAGQGRMINGGAIVKKGGETVKSRRAGDDDRKKINTASTKGKKKNFQPQRTIGVSVVLCGQGLHSGLKTGLILSPLPPGSGIVFWDIGSGRRLPAAFKNVRSTEYATTLSDGEVTINTVEHIMSALHSFQITNLLVKIGDEAPIMDGSAIDFCQIIEDGGVKEQDQLIEQIVINRRISVGDPKEGPYICVEPADQFSIDYYLDYPAPIGKQEHHYVYESGAHYKETIAPARTFGFLRDIKMLEEAGLASGGKLSNVILIDSEKVINTPLRFPNEPARHKILDLIGDLYLLGRPIKGRFTARKSGHTQNVKLVTKIQESLKNHKPEKNRHANGR